MIRGRSPIFNLFRGLIAIAITGVGCSRSAPPEQQNAAQADNQPTVTQVDVRFSASPPGPPSVKRLQSADGTLFQSRPLAAPSIGGDTLFTQLDEQASGVDFTSPLDLSHPLKRLYLSGFATSGICIGDIDGNERPDLFFASGPTSNRLYKQVDSLRFEEVTQQAGLKSSNAWSAGAAMADIDGDGDLDIFVCNYEIPCQLYLNDGTGKFKASDAEWLSKLKDACLMPSFSDYDNDGDLDLFILTNRLHRENGRPKNPPVNMVLGVPEVKSEFKRYYGLNRKSDGSYNLDTVGRPDRLLRNDGGGTFVDVSDSAGLHGHGHGLSATWWDFNNDHLTDLYVANDFDDPDRLYRNNGDGTFTDVLVESVPHTSWFSMGADSADLNGDGRFDLLVADMSARSHFDQKTTMGAMNAQKLAKVSGPPPQIMKNALLIGSDTERLFEAAELAGLADTDWTWSVRLSDFDNDSLVDVAFTNGIARNFNDSDIKVPTHMLVGRTEWSLFESTPARRERNLVKRNLGNLKFQDVSKEWGFNHYGMSYACAQGDLDRDGDIDLVVVNLDGPAHVYRNDSPSGNRLLVTLKGTGENTNGIGAKLTLVSSDGKQQIRMVSPYTGFLASNDLAVHFGLGEAETVKQLTVEWPSGARQQLGNLRANQWVTVYESNSSSDGSVVVEPEPETRPLFKQMPKALRFTHRETEYNDFARQPLLPNKLSQLGPGVAVCDVTGDGWDDLYIGGAKGQKAALLIADGQGGYQPRAVAAFDEDFDCEDMGAVWLDADADGYPDLYVVSGGVECEAGDPVLQDRLYLNNGEGNFTKATSALPELRDSGSVACAADFDRDGDLDLFVGTRVIPGAYPETPPSRLLQNDGGKFTDVTAEVSPALLKAGLVTSGVWSDANGDGWIDLLLTTEWGPVKLLINREGELTDATESAGLAARKGWYNGIAARDLDGDGDIDYAVTNFGLNTKYHASAAKPALLYYGDFEGEGKKRLVEAEFESDVLFPIRGKSCSTGAMPMLGDKFKSYREFASATLQEIYTPTCLQEATRFECNSLETGVLWNDGNGAFEFTQLPWLAQVSPSFGVLATEVNGDAYPDLYLAQNFFTAQPETGRMDGGMGLLLFGTENKEFLPVMPGESGLMVPGDAKSAVFVHNETCDNVTLVVGVNSARPEAFRLTHPTSRAVLPGGAKVAPKFVAVRLRGQAGNPAGYGSRVELHCADGSQQVAEVSAGQGYLSQTTSTLTFAVDLENPPKRLRVVWPTGVETLTEYLPRDIQIIDEP